jgi:hypothetical protein
MESVLPHDSKPALFLLFPLLILKIHEIALKKMEFFFSLLNILLPNGKIVFMEMKKQKGGKLSYYQANFIKKCESLGHIALIGYGASDASEKILKELSKNT